MRLDIKRKDNEVTIYIAGRLDTQASPELESAIAPFLGEVKLNFIVNIKEMEYISSSGVRCFVMLFRATRKNEGSLKIENMRPEIHEIFEMTGLASMFGV